MDRLDSMEKHGRETDMSAQAIDRRLRKLSELQRLAHSLANAQPARAQAVREERKSYDEFP